MRGPLGTLAALLLAMLVIAPLTLGAEQTRETYKERVEPVCKANREANERIMSGARQRVNKNKLKPAGKQFVRLSDSFGKLIKRLAPVPPPVGDERRIGRWIESMKLLKTRVRLVGKYFIAGEKIRANHESILAERAGISANNTSIVLHFHDCRFGRFDRG